MIVAVAVPVSPPDQHSPKLGHLASSQTVWSFNSRSFFLICTYFSPPGIDSFIHFGFGSGFFFVPTSTEYELPDFSAMKSDSDGDSSASLARSPARVCENSDGAALVVVVVVEDDEKGFAAHLSFPAAVLIREYIIIISLSLRDDHRSRAQIDREREARRTPTPTTTNKGLSIVNGPVIGTLGLHFANW